MLGKDKFLQMSKSNNGGLTTALLSKLSKLAGGGSERKQPPLVWLETNTCTGAILSLLNFLDPSLKQLLFELVDFRFSNLLMAAEGSHAINVLDELVKMPPVSARRKTGG